MSVSELDRWDYNKREVLHNESPNIADSEWKPADPVVTFSTIRSLIQERDQIREENTELLEMLEEIAVQLRRGQDIYEWYSEIADTIEKAKGE